MKKFKFLQSMDLDRLEERMDKLSREGWELEKFKQICDNFGNIHTTVLMSKEIEENGK